MMVAMTAAPEGAGMQVRGFPLATVGAAVASIAAMVVVFLQAPGLLPGSLYLANLAGLGWVAGHDVAFRRAPNVVVLPGIAFAVSTAGALGAESGIEAAAGAVIAFLVMTLVFIFGRGRMGFGDVKYAAWCGALAGPALVPYALLGGTLSASLLVLGVIAWTRSRRPGRTLPFTPFLALGALLATAAGGGVLL